MESIPLIGYVSCWGDEITHIPKRSGEPDCTFADTTRIETKLGWKAKALFEEGAQNVHDNIDYWREVPVWTTQTVGKAIQGWFRYLGRG